MARRGPSLREIMVTCAAREIRDGDVVFVGMRLPLAAFAVAKDVHAPRAIGLFENGVIRDAAPAGPVVTMADPPNIAGAIACTSLLDVMALLQQGRVDLGLLGAAEVDRYGNLNTTRVGAVRLPGSGGSCDIASLSRRFVVLMAHERRRFPERVAYRTSPGHGSGRDWRRRVGLRGEGPDKLITTLGTFASDQETGELILISIHPGATLDAVRETTAWPVRVAPDLQETPLPTPEELRALALWSSSSWMSSSP